MGECPRLYVSDQSQEMVQLFARSLQMKEAAGASLFGNDISKWPSRLVDAFVVLQGESTRVTSLEMKHLQKT